MLRLGILGGGNIGYRIAQSVAAGTLPYRLSMLLERNAEAVERMRALQPDIAVAASLDELARGCDVLVECAASTVVRELIAAARAAGDAGPRSIVVLSVGGLLAVELDAPGPLLHVPAGAIGGLEAIQALSVEGLDAVELTTRKPPAGLGREIDTETVLFEGSARDAIAQFPKNVNVAIALSLAGIGPDRTRVRVIADPAVERNTHHIRARGPAGEVEFISRNVPFPANPATSYLAALSAIALLKRLTAGLQVG